MDVSRFNARIGERIIITRYLWNDSPCWRWKGCHESRGRPIYHGKYVYRLMYELERGSLSIGDVAHHGCEHMWCINPWHLVLMSQSNHMKVHDAGGDWGQALKTYCPHGHPYDDANTYRYARKDGSQERHCRACHMERTRRKRHGQRQA